MATPAATYKPSTQSQALLEFVQRYPRLFVLTGAGVSTDSGIPDYRDASGEWKRASPVTLQAFLGNETTRRRYWARSLIGWPSVANARPGAAHYGLAELQRLGHVHTLLTQNVDGLHQAAGSRDVEDLHGRIDRVTCLACAAQTARASFQNQLHDANPGWQHLTAVRAPDGDADLDHADFANFNVPDCEYCGGLLKPDVVFFGENVPRPRVARSFERLQTADALLVVGSSLMVFSGFRFARAAAGAGLPIAILNRGRTRADALAQLKVDAPCGPALTELANH